MGIGILSVVVAATILGIAPSMQKQVMVDGLPILSLMFFTSLVISAVSFLIALLTRQSFRITRPQLIQALALGCSGMVITAMLINTAYLYMPVGMVTMLHFLYPSIVCIVMGTVFKAGFSKLQAAAIVVSIAGMVCLAGKGGDLPMKGIVLALASALAYGAYLIGNEKGPVNDLPLSVKMFYFSLPGLFLFIPLAPLTHNLVTPSSPVSWFQLLVCSGLATVAGYFLMAFGIKKLGASTASFLSMLEPVVSVVFSVLWFHDPVTSRVVAGSLLILTSVLLITINDARKAKQPSPAQP